MEKEEDTVEEEQGIEQDKETRGQEVQAKEK